MAFEIAGYQVRDRLYQGRYVSVHRAVRSLDGLPLVVKLANAPKVDAVVTERLRNEYGVLQRLDHPRVAAPHALVPHGAGVALFSEYRGAPLRERIVAELPAIDEVLRLAVQLAEALVHVHDAGVIHKDVNPANVVVDPDSGDLTLIDFDLAAVVSHEFVEVRSVGALQGTLAYMAPEQTGRTNRTVDSRADLYSVGATLYEMLTGSPPFTAADRLTLVHQHIAVPPARPSARRPDVPPVLDEIVLRLLAKTPEERYQSASGLLFDLRRTLEPLGEGGDDGHRDGHVQGFTIGTADVSRRFQVPERLYGREQEVRSLVGAFRRTVDDGRPTLVLVSGEPGIGKSSLVNEIHAPITEARGAFVSGKFDQFKRNVPFASLIEALRELVRRVLSEPDDQLRRHQDRLRVALGPNGRLLTDAIPELERLLGPLEPVPDLAPMESRNRFRQVFRSFVEVFAQAEHPLCILLDDVQWIDSATLEWIEATVADRSIGPLLLICAYRDNEVGRSHPFAVSLDRLRDRDVPIDHVVLEPLSSSTVRELVADTLAADPGAVGPLADLLHTKTGGNPFFLNQLLTALHRDGAIWFDASMGGWEFDLDRIVAANITENVVEYMTQRLHLLPVEAQAMIKLAACVGNSFDADLLAVAAESSAPDALARLHEPLDQGLVIKTGETYRFLHDRVQQAAYDLMDEEEARRAHGRIGRRILADVDVPESDERLFEILQHFDRADPVTDPGERGELARLNLAGAARARRATAYGPAHHLVCVGLDLLPATEGGRLRFDLSLERAVCEHLAGDDQAAVTWFDRAIDAAHDDFERAEVYERKIHFHTNQARFDLAYETGLEAAAMLGIWMPKTFIPPLLIADHVKILRHLRGTEPMDLVDRPEMDDERLQLAMRFMGAVAKAAYQIRPELCVSICARIVLVSLTQGYTPETAIGFLAYGVIFRGGVRGDHRTGFEFSRLVQALIERFDNQQQRAEVVFVSGYFANSWIAGLADSEELFRRAYRAGTDTGDLFHASLSCTATVQNMLMRGVDLRTVSAEASRFREFLERAQNHENLGATAAVQQTVANLQGATFGPGSFSDADFDEEAFEPTLADYGSPHLAHIYYVDKLLTLLLWHRYDEAVVVAARSAQHLKDSPGMQQAAEHHFLDGLLHAQLATTVHRQQRPRHLLALRRSLRRHRQWAADAPGSFEHKALLLDAELQRLLGHHDRAARRYDEAVEHAERAGYQQTAALAHERAGDFHAGIGATRTAQFHLAEAAQGYERWGATALADELVRRHPTLLGGMVFDGPAAPPTSDRTEHGDRSLDLETLMKASQALSGEVQLAEVLRGLMTIARENAGAERGVLLRLDDGELTPQAEVRADGEVFTSIDGGPHEYGGWAPSIVNFVVRSGEPMVVADAAAELRLRDDPHVAATRPRSVLCAPLNHLGSLSGVLYLENNLAAGAFTDERLEVLTLLSGQIGISIANAELYEDLEGRVKDRTAQLEARNRFIRHTFGRYLTDDIVDSILDTADGAALVGETRTVTIILSDLRGFTPMVEELPPQKVMWLINLYLGAMTDVLTRHKATILDLIGDEIVAVFGAPFTHDDDAARAVACAVDMQRAMEQVNLTAAESGYPALGMGIGLDTGDVVVGSIGSETRAKYTILGNALNLASRIETYTVAGDILVSERTRDAVGAILDVSGSIEVHPKGVTRPITVSYVRGIGGRFDLHLEERTAHLVDLDPPAPITFVDIDGKHVGDHEVDAWLERMSESEAIVRSDRSPEALANLRVTFPGDGATMHAYAKVTSARDDTPAGCFRLAFTSTSERTRAHMTELLAAATR